MAVPNLWRTQKQRYSLQGEVCPACAQTVFPPREVCPHCGRSMHEIPGGKAQAEIYSFALILPTPAGVGIAGDD